MAEALEDNRSAVHSKHTPEQMIRQRVYQMAAGYEDCNDADFLRINIIPYLTRRRHGLIPSRW
ncbi:transposase [Desulfarculus baarsii]|uniref:transposase n=1 Tax=Desulfarculus baarsii TaxID=453230 RepID=UPI0011D16FBA